MKSPRTQLIYGALTFGLAVLVVETLAFLMLSAAAGRWMTPDQITELQQEAIQGGGEPVKLKRDQNDDARLLRYVGSEAIHPYLGFVMDRKFQPQKRFDAGGDDALDYGFVLNQPGIFHEPSPDRPVIAVTGGSVAFVFADVVLGELREELLAILPEYEQAVFVSLALPGYKQPQQLMALSYFLALGAHFDAVINIDGFNEVALSMSENMSLRVHPFFPRSWYFRVQDFDPETRLEVGELAYRLGHRKSLAWHFSRAPWRYSPTAGLVWTALDRWAQREIVERELALDSSDRIAVDYTVSGPPWRVEDDAATYRELVKLWQRTSEQMHALATARGIRYYHFLQPNQYHAGSKPMSDEERQIAIQTEDYPMGEHAAAAYPLLVEHGRQLVDNGVTFEDLTQLFATVEEPVYLDRCCHFNTLGMRYLVRAIAEKIRQDLEQQRRISKDE